MTVAHKCPRRHESMHEMHPDFDKDDGWREDKTCTWCGSLHPDAFMQAAESGVEIQPTDKDYKSYLDLPNPDVGKPVLFSTWNNPPADVLERIKGDPNWKQTGPRSWEEYRPAPARRHHKFYFQHLSDEQRRHFVELLNAKAVKIGYPGRFYRMPFFIRCAESA